MPSREQDEDAMTRGAERSYTPQKQQLVANAAMAVKRNGLGQRFEVPGRVQILLLEWVKDWPVSYQLLVIIFWSKANLESFYQEMNEAD
jgi:hypothetical protein